MLGTKKAVHGCNFLSNHRAFRTEPAQAFKPRHPQHTIATMDSSPISLSPMRSHSTGTHTLRRQSGHAVAELLSAMEVCESMTTEHSELPAPTPRIDMSLTLDNSNQGPPGSCDSDNEQTTEICRDCTAQEHNDVDHTMMTLGRGSCNASSKTTVPGTTVRFSLPPPDSGIRGLSSVPRTMIHQAASCRSTTARRLRPFTPFRLHGPRHNPRSGTPCPCCPQEPTVSFAAILVLFLQN
jgi:hypothetical protein